MHLSLACIEYCLSSNCSRLCDLSEPSLDANTPLWFDGSLHRRILPRQLGRAEDLRLGAAKAQLLIRDTVLWENRSIEHTIPWVTPRHTTSYNQLHYIPTLALNINTVETPLQSHEGNGLLPQGAKSQLWQRKLKQGQGSASAETRPNAKGMRVHCVECRPKWKDPKIQGLQRRWTMSMDILRLPIETQRITINPELNNQIRDQVPNLCLQKTSNFRPIWANAPIFCTHNNGRRFSDLNVGKLNKSLAWGQTQPGQSRVSGLAIPAG